MRLLDKYRAVRARTMALADPLSAEDQMVQSMPDASPTKWHLAHTSWFFETFLLAPHAAGFRPFNAHYGFLFNSYYEALGERLDRARRGTLARPALAEVLAYRRHVDDAVGRLWETTATPTASNGAMLSAISSILELGLHHEQQHQELLLTDIKHVFGSSPLQQAYHVSPQPWTGPDAPPTDSDGPEAFQGFDEGLTWIGHPNSQDDGKSSFAFDNEGPRHRYFLRAFQIAARPVTCGAYTAFIEDGGYDRADLWLSEGWQLRAREQWRAPLYWEKREGRWTTYTLGGVRAVDAREPVAHVSYFEADAFARWAGARLPTEQEWERAAAEQPVQGRFADTGHFHPGPARRGFFGDVWQWTQSPYGPFPGYRAPAGAIGEYNGKFMCNQMVLRGGSCLTPEDHMRLTYRNFFPPAARWQASGIRLAQDA